MTGGRAARIACVSLAAALVGCGMPTPRSPLALEFDGPTAPKGLVTASSGTDVAPAVPAQAPSPATANPWKGVASQSGQDDLLLFFGAFLGIAGVTGLMIGLGFAMNSVQSATK